MKGFLMAAAYVAILIAGFALYCVAWYTIEWHFDLSGWTANILCVLYFAACYLLRLTLIPMAIAGYGLWHYFGWHPALAFVVVCPGIIPMFLGGLAGVFGKLSSRR